MSVGISPELKYMIIDHFQSCGNKTKTGLMYNISPRTVGRIVIEYDQIMNGGDDIYIGMFTEMNVLVTPDTPIMNIDLNLFDSLFITKDESIYDHFDDHDEPIDKLIKRLVKNKIITVGVDDIAERVAEEYLTSHFDAFVKEDDETLVEEMPTSYFDALMQDDDDEPSASDYEWQLVATAQSITITRTNDDGTESVEIAKGTDNFRKSWAIIRTVDMTEEEQVAIASEEIYTMADPKLAIEKFTQGNITVDVKNESLHYCGAQLNNSLTTRIIHMTTNRGLDGGQALLNFLEKLMQNTSYRAVNSLYDFLQHNDIEIADNGNFYAWKRVRADFTDCHTGMIDNSVGASPTMPRNMVNEDPEQTCSNGLHVAAKHYLSCFHGPVTLRCEVDPRDVVCIPKDYNASKIRTCHYKVVEDVTRTMLYN